MFRHQPVCRRREACVPTGAVEHISSSGRSAAGNSLYLVAALLPAFCVRTVLSVRSHAILSLPFSFASSRSRVSIGHLPWSGGGSLRRQSAHVEVRYFSQDRCARLPAAGELKKLLGLLVALSVA